MTAPPNRLPFQEQGAERKEESHDGRDGASNAHRKDGVKEDGDGSGGNSFNNLFLLFFGSGTFALPWGFVHGGLLGGILGVFAVAGITYVTISMLVAAKRCQLRRLSMMHSDPSSAARAAQELQQSLSYASITAHAFGNPRAGLLVKAATTLSSLGACAGYLTFVCGLLAPLIRRLEGEQNDEYQSQSSDSPRNDWPLFALARMDQQSLMTCLLPVLIPLTWVRSFKDLACTSTIGNVIFILAVLAVLHDGLQRFGPPALSDFASEGGVLRLWPESASSFALFFSPCIYLFTVHYCALPIEAEGPTVVSTAITSHSGGGAIRARAP